MATFVARIHHAEALALTSTTSVVVQGRMLANVRPEVGGIRRWACYRDVLHALPFVPHGGKYLDEAVIFIDVSSPQVKVLFGSCRITTSDSQSAQPPQAACAVSRSSWQPQDLPPLGESLRGSQALLETHEKTAAICGYCGNSVDYAG